MKLKTFEELSKEVFELKKIPTIENYYAHLREEKEVILHRETLLEHTEKIKKLFLKQVKILNWDRIIDNLILDILDHLNEELILIIEKYNLKNLIAEKIKLFFFDGILFHDYGKLNPQFQKKKMKNDLNVYSPFSSEHAFISLVLLFSYYSDYIDSFLKLFKIDKDDYEYFYYVLLFFLGIMSLSAKNHHHSEIINSATLDSEFCNINSLYSEENYKIFEKSGFSFKNLKKQIRDICNISQNMDTLFLNYDYFSLFLFIKFHFSVLNRIDYLATVDYYFNLNLLEKKENLVLTREDIETLNTNFYSISYNKDLLKFNKELNSIKDLNELRSLIAKEVYQEIQKNYQNQIFYLQAPTGAGKTNLSILVALELLKKRKDLNKIIYVVPFNTLSDQIYNWLRENLFKNELEIKLFQIHNSTGFLEVVKKFNHQSKNGEEQDAFYGKEKQFFLDYLFMNFPVIIMSHIRFFNILKSSFKKDNYFLSQILNAIVILDEIQSYPPKEWDKLKFFIENSSQYLNLCYVIMSATLPKIHQLQTSEIKQTYCNLIKEPKKYFRHPLFKNRVKFNFDLLETKSIKENSIKDIIIYEHLSNILYNNNHKESLKIVIEFISKKGASHFFRFLENKKNEDKFLKNYDLLFLSSTILPFLRKKTLSKINNKSKVILVTTQVIEAGIDLDFDIGYKDIAILDSEEQLAGRINRNSRKENCFLYLLDYTQTGTVYKGDYRYKILREMDQESIYKRFLIRKDFDSYYEHILKFINELNKADIVKNFEEYKLSFKNLNFREIHKNFEIINSHTISLFIPVQIEKEFLSEEEIQFLQENQIKVSEKVNGEDIWNLYLEGMKIKNYYEKTIFFEKFSHLLNQFIISIYYNENLLAKLIEYSDAEYLNKTHILYLKKYESIYNHHTGLDIENILENDDFIL